MSKWFKTDQDWDSDATSEEETEYEESEESEEADRRESSQPVNRFLLGAGKGSKEGAAPQVRQRTTVRSALEKFRNELAAAVEDFQAKLLISDYGVAFDILENIMKITNPYQDHADLPNSFLAMLVTTEQDLRDVAASLDKAEKKKRDALKLLRSKLAKAIAFHQEAINARDIAKRVAEGETFGSESEGEASEGEGDTRVAAAAKTSAEGDKAAARERMLRDAAEAGDIPSAPELLDDYITLRLDVLVRRRGKKVMDASAHISELYSMLDAKPKAAAELCVAAALVSAAFDLQRVADTIEHGPFLSACVATVRYIAALLRAEEDKVAYEELGPQLAGAEEVELVPETRKARRRGPAASSVVKVSGSLLSFVMRLHDEYTRTLQLADPHGPDYPVRFADEGCLTDILERSFVFYKTRQPQWAAAVAALLTSHLHWRRPVDHKALLARQRKIVEQLQQRCINAAAKLEPSDESKKLYPVVDKEVTDRIKIRWASLDPSIWSETVRKQEDGTSLTVVTEELVDGLGVLVDHVLQYGEEKLKPFAILRQVHALALHGNYCIARDLLLVSRLHEVVVSQSNSVQLMACYNRCLAALGIAAFCAGKLQDSHRLLGDLLYGSSQGGYLQRTREILGQAIPTLRRDLDALKRAEIERQEKQKLAPFHTHLNTDLVDAVLLVSALPVEVPGMVARTTKETSQPTALKRVIDAQAAQTFAGPPESMREFVFAAFRALSAADWEGALKLLVTAPIWGLLSSPVDIEALLSQSFKISSLKTHIIRCAGHRAAIPIAPLCSQFQLTHVQVIATLHSIVLSDELPASLDEPAGVLRVHAPSPTDLHLVTLACADTAKDIAGYNERFSADLARLDEGSHYYRSGTGDNYRRDGYQRQMAHSGRVSFNYREGQSRDGRGRGFASSRRGGGSWGGPGAFRGRGAGHFMASPGGSRPYNTYRTPQPAA